MAGLTVSGAALKGVACAGYVYGLWIAAGLIASGCKRIMVLAGFGVGLSWGAAALEPGPIVAPPLEEAA
jgi:3-oxoacyl-[acyl-carrier-protein] synthase III